MNHRRPVVLKTERLTLHCFPSQGLVRLCVTYKRKHKLRASCFRVLRCVPLPLHTFSVNDCIADCNRCAEGEVDSERRP